MRLEFAPIDVDRYADICVRFQHDAFVVSYGTAEEMIAADTYLEWLRHCIRQDPDSRVHVWVGSRLVGQCELSSQWRFENTGCVHLYYLVPSFYERHGWRSLGPREDHPASLYMQKVFAQSPGSPAA